MSRTAHLKYRIYPLLFAFVFSTATRALAQQAPVQPDALAAAKQAFDAGKYQDAVTTIARELARNLEVRNPGPSPQRYQLLMLKGESFLRLNERISAADAFAQARTSAADPGQAAMAVANSLLARESPNNKYVSTRNRTAPPIDILDPASRKQAAAAMKDDRMAALEPKVAQAKTADMLPIMFEVLKPLLDVAALEYAATGSSDQTRATLAQLGSHARELINAELKRISYRLSALEDASNSVEGTGNLLSRRGLHSNEIDEVKETVQYLKQIEQTARDVRRLGQTMGLQTAAWEPIASDSADLIDRAQAMLSVGP
jgi:hypothetical protein